MGERYFEPADVERLIPDLTRIMERALAAHAEAQSVAASLETERQRIAVAGGGIVNRAAWRRSAQRVDELHAAVREGLREIGELGGTPKDLALGLVDFPTLRDGHVVNLCWKLGEKTVRWWHGLDEGYAGRKPL